VTVQVEVNVSAVPQGDAVIQGPQQVTITTGPPGPPGPSSPPSLDLVLQGFTDQLDEATAAFTIETNLRIAGDEALAAVDVTLQAGVDTNAAAIATEATARANADTALASSITALTATVGSNTAAIAAEATARANADSALATSISTLEAEVVNARDGQANLLARLTQINTARVDGDTALASSITAVSAVADMGTASGAVRLIAQAGGAGISAQYAWEIVAGSKLVGMRAIVTSGGDSRVEFNADQFRIYSGSTVLPVFAIDGSTIVMNGAVRVNGSLITGTIGDSTLPSVIGLGSPYSEHDRMPYHLDFDNKGRLTDIAPAHRLYAIDIASGGGDTGKVPYISNTAVPPATPGAPGVVEVWGFFSTSSFGRGLAGAANAAAGRTSLGLGTMATQDASAVAITGGTAVLSTLTTSGDTTIRGVWGFGATAAVFSNGTVNYRMGLISGDIVYIGTFSNHQIAFQRNNAEFMRLYDSGGGATALAIGKTTYSITTPGINFAPNGYAEFVTTYAGSTVMVINRQANDGTAITFQYINSTKGTIVIGTSSTAYNTTSDENQKLRLGYYSPEHACEIILRDPVWYFRWVLEPDGSPHANGETAVGWGAQTSYAVSSDLASPGEGTFGTPDYRPWGVDQSKRTPYLWAAMTWAIPTLRALEDRVDHLDAANDNVNERIAALEAEIALLKQQQAA